MDAETAFAVTFNGESLACEDCGGVWFKDGEDGKYLCETCGASLILVLRRGVSPLGGGEPHG